MLHRQSHNAVVPDLFGTWGQFHGRQFEMIQAHYIYSVLYLYYYYYIISTPDHQALDLGG